MLHFLEGTTILSMWCDMHGDTKEWTSCFGSHLTSYTEHCQKSRFKSYLQKIFIIYFNIIAQQ